MPPACPSTPHHSTLTNPTTTGGAGCSFREFPARGYELPFAAAWILQRHAAKPVHRGYVKLWRKAEDSGLMRDHKTWAVWSWILIHAAHKPRSVVVGRIAVALLPGQLVFGRKALSEALNLTEQNVRSCLKLLEKLKNITIKPTNKFSILTVVNWELYQSEDQQPTNKVTNWSTDAQPATNQQSARAYSSGTP